MAVIKRDLFLKLQNTGAFQIKKYAREGNDKGEAKLIGKRRSARKPCSTTFMLFMTKSVLHVCKAHAATRASLFTIKFKRDDDASKPRSDWLNNEK